MRPAVRGEYSCQCYGPRDILHVAARRDESCEILLDRNSPTAIVHSLQHREEPVQRIARPINHRERQHGARQSSIGARWAPAAAAALALSLPEQYTSRGTFSEPLVQILLFGGLCLLIDAFLVPPRPAKTPAKDAEAKDAEAKDAEARDTTDPGQDRVLAALAGLVLGLAVLVRIDALSDILPAVPFLGLLLAARRRQGIPFGLGLAAGVGYGLAGGYLLSRPYLDLVGPSLRPLGLITAVIVVLTAIALCPPIQNQLKRLRASKKATTWLPPAAAALVIAAFAALAVRPVLDHARYDQNGLVWVIWYLGLPAVLLGASGLAVLASRGAKSLLTHLTLGLKQTRSGPFLKSVFSGTLSRIAKVYDHSCMDALHTSLLEGAKTPMATILGDNTTPGSKGTVQKDSQILTGTVGPGGLSRSVGPRTGRNDAIHLTARRARCYAHGGRDKGVSKNADR